MRGRYYSYILTFLFTLGVSIFSGCGSDNIIPEDKFVEVYTDIILATDTSSENLPSKDDIIKNVLMKHSVTLEEYKSMVQYYNQETERWEKFFTKAAAYLEKKRKNAAK